MSPVDSQADLREIRRQLLGMAGVVQDLVRRVDSLMGRQPELAPASSVAVAEPPAPRPAPKPVVPTAEELAAIPVSRSVSAKLGEITWDVARRKAEILGEFSPQQYAQELGLTVSGAMRWLKMLLDRDVAEFVAGRYRTVEPPVMQIWVVNQRDVFDFESAMRVTRLSADEAMNELERLEGKQIVERVNGSGTWRYVPPPSYLAPREHPSPLPPEKERPSYELAPPRGMPIRKSASDRSTRRTRSVEGARGIKGPAQRDRRHKQMEEAKAKRAEESRTKAQQDPKWQNRGGKRRAA